jgi:large subunit ribosomal protein L4
MKKEIEILNQENKPIATYTLKNKFWFSNLNKQIIYDVIKAERSNKRKVISKVKSRGEVSGGGRKPWKQKGTGRARQGSIRAPQWKGGGVVFGPTGKQNYSLKVNKKIKVKALGSLLALKFKLNNLIVVDNLLIDKYSTKLFLSYLKNLNLDKEKIIIVLLKNENDNQNNQFIIKSASNLKKVKVSFVNNLSKYDLLNYNKLLLTQESLNFLEDEIK